MEKCLGPLKIWTSFLHVHITHHVIKSLRKIYLISFVYLLLNLLPALLTFRILMKIQAN